MARQTLAAFLSLAIGILVTFSSTPTALAQTQCGTRAAFERALLQKYQESPVFSGVTHNGGLIVVLATESGSTWSILVASADGMACLVASGENWRPSEMLPGEPS